MRHTEHCLKRQLWGDGECECGLFDDYKQAEKKRNALAARWDKLRQALAEARYAPGEVAKRAPPGVTAAKFGFGYAMQTAVGIMDELEGEK